jgi:hypothetical protein
MFLLLQKDLDGAYFGTSFPHVFLLTFPDLIPHCASANNIVSQPYEPRIFGFKVHRSSLLFGNNPDAVRNSNGNVSNGRIVTKDDSKSTTSSTNCDNNGTNGDTNFPIASTDTIVVEQTESAVQHRSSNKRHSKRQRFEEE